MVDSDSDDLAAFAPSGLSQSSTSSVSPKKKKRKAMSQEVEEIGDAQILKRAKRVIGKTQIPEEITSIDQLAWHKYKSKQFTHIYPVRKGAKDMIMHLNVQQDFDEKKKCAVEYLAYGTPGKRNVVFNSQLIPYGEDGIWNEGLLTDYLKSMATEGKHTALDIKKEELYLIKILKVAGERESGEVEEELVDQIDGADLVVEPSAAEDLQSALSSSTTTISGYKQEPLRAGDIIEYTETMYRGGDKRGLRKAVVLVVTPGRRKASVLNLHNNDILPENHPVKRLLCRKRQETVTNENPSYRPIQAYKLVKSALKQTEQDTYKKQTYKQLNDIIDRNLAKLQENAEKDGAGVFMDMMSLKSKSKKEEEQTNESAKRNHADGVEKLQAQLNGVRRRMRRRKIHHMSENYLELALQVHSQITENMTIEELAELLGIEKTPLAAFLCGDEGTKIPLKQHKKTANTLRKWLKKQPTQKQEEKVQESLANGSQLDKPVGELVDNEPIDDEPVDDEPGDDEPGDDKPINEPVDDKPINDEPGDKLVDEKPVENEAIKKLQAQLERIRKQTGRRRSMSQHMSETLLELAIKVHQQMLNEKMSIIDLEEVLDDEDATYSLKYFLAGDEKRIIRLASHEAMAKTLMEWMAPFGQEDGPSSMEGDPEAETVDIAASPERNEKSIDSKQEVPNSKGAATDSKKEATDSKKEAKDSKEEAIEPNKKSKVLKEKGEVLEEKASMEATSSKQEDMTNDRSQIRTGSLHSVL